MPFETPGAVERTERLSAVAAMICLIFSEGYSASGDTAEIRSPLCEEAIRLARLIAAAVPERARDHGADGIAAARNMPAAARFDADGAVILLRRPGSEPCGIKR